MHTVKATAELIYQQGGQFVLPVKENRRALFDALDGLTWNDTPIAHSSIDIGHGRVTRRTIRVRPAPADLPFPHVNQVWLIERYVTDTTGRHVSAVAQLGVTSDRTSQASPAEVAGYVQGQWAIEVLHWLRDTCYHEDNSTVRTRSGPRILASLRNLAIGALRLAGRQTSPKPPGGPAATCAGHSPSSASHHDLEAAVRSRRDPPSADRVTGDRRGMKLREGSPGP